ncbi:hypothetical protein JCM3770_004313 [Rhodotorula araucariae]
MARRYSGSSASSGEDSESSRSSTHSGRTASRTRSAAPPRGPYRDAKSDESPSSGTEDDLAGAEDAYAGERAAREARKAARRAAAGTDATAKRPTRVMRSLGLNKTTMHKLVGIQDDGLHHSDNTSLLAEKNRTDPENPEAGAVLESRKSSLARASPKRRIYIGIVAFLLVLLLVVGVGLGILFVKRRQAYESQISDQEAADKADLDAQGLSMQSVLGMTSAGNGHGGSAATTAASAVASLATQATKPVVASLPSPTGVLDRFPTLQELFFGNRAWRNETAAMDAAHMVRIAKAQGPKVAYIGCADSRVPETTVFGAEPVQVAIYVSPPVGNQYLIDDLSSETVMSYAVAHLGHTRCGAVQAAIASPSDEVLTNMDETRIDTWIRPIRSLYAASNRSEIVKFREAHKAQKIAGKDVTDEVWLALIEENVKLNVQRVAMDSTVQKVRHPLPLIICHDADDSFTPPSRHGMRFAKRASGQPAEIWVHGRVYDVTNGLVSDLGVSLGPN